MKTIMLIALLAITFHVNAGDHYVGLGLFTEHYVSDDDRFNENNELVYYHYVTDNNVALVGTFSNSHFIRSHVAGIGREFHLSQGVKAGVLLGLIEGYDTVLDVNCGKYMCMPLFYIKTGIFNHMIMGPAYNLSVSYKF